MTNFKLVTRVGFLALALSLAGCGGDSGGGGVGSDGGIVGTGGGGGGSGGGGGGGGSIIGSTNPTAPVADGFFTAILALISTSPDNTEPTDISAIAATSPDNTEPVANAF